MSPPEDPPLPREGRPGILIVDNDSDVRILVQDFLERSGFEILHAESGEEGLQMLEDPGRERLDLVLLDLRMPGMGGLGFLRQLESRPSVAPDLPVLVVSGYMGEEDRRELGRNPRVRALIKKPFDLFVLLSEAQAALEAQAPNPGREA